MQPKLITPHADFSASFAEALREGLYLDENSTDEAALVEKDFTAWLTDLMDMEKPITLPDGTAVRKVPASYFWLVSGDRFLGSINLRHSLSKNLENIGGHIGYSVRMSERQKGYASLMLRETLKIAKDMGMDKVLVTCRDDNTGSIGVIEKVGGVLTDKVTPSFRDLPERRYWISLP